jgi:hypothetical protein
MAGKEKYCKPGSPKAPGKKSSMRGAPPAEGYRHLGRFQTGIPRKEYPRP